MTQVPALTPVPSTPAATEAAAAPVFTMPDLHVMLPGFSCVVFSEDAEKRAIQEGYQQIYIVTSMGMLRRDGLTHGRSVTSVATSIAGIKPIVRTASVLDFFPKNEKGQPMKPPMQLLRQIVAFFKEVMAQHSGQNLEAMAHIIWNPTQGYHIRIPVQKVSAARVEYSWEGYLGPDDVIVVDCHSHNNMGEHNYCTMH